MNSENFCYWLQGMLEIGNPKSLSGEQLDVIKEHLNLVFEKKTQKSVLGEANCPVNVDIKVEPKIESKEVEDLKPSLKGITFTGGPNTEPVWDPETKQISFKPKVSRSISYCSHHRLIC